MLLNKTLLMTALMLGLSTGVANAHQIPLPVAGDPYNVTEPVINWANGVGTSLNSTLSDDTHKATLLAYHFDVTSAGSLDVYTNDHDVGQSLAALYIYKLDAGGQDWTLTHFSNQGAAPVVSALDPNNIFGVHRTGYLDQYNTGTADAGVRANFDIGSYVAMVVGSAGYVTNHTPYDTVPDPTGAKLSDGYTWAYSGDPADFLVGNSGPSDLTIKASPGSLAIAGATVEQPAAVPVPGAIWLMGTVLAGFGAFGRKKIVVAA